MKIGPIIRKYQWVDEDGYVHMSTDFSECKQMSVLEENKKANKKEK